MVSIIFAVVLVILITIQSHCLIVIYNCYKDMVKVEEPLKTTDATISTTLNETFTVEEEETFL